MDQNTRFHVGEMDLGDCIETTKEFYIDIITERLEDEKSEMFELLEKIRAKKKYLKDDFGHGTKDIERRDSISSVDDDDFVINDSPLPQKDNSGAKEVKKADKTEEKEQPIESPKIEEKQVEDKPEITEDDEDVDEESIDKQSDQEPEKKQAYDEEEKKALEKIMASSSEEDKSSESDDGDEDMDEYLKKLESQT